MVKSSLLTLLVLLFSVQAAVATPKIQSWQTRAGARVMYVQASELPMIDVRVVFDAGSARDGDLPGLAGFTNSMLTEGAGDWNADQLAERLEDKGVELGSGSLRDMAWLSVRSLTEKAALSTALESLAVILARPRLEQADIERVRQRKQISLRQKLQSPGGLAKQVFMQEIYGDHPYGHDATGTDASLPAITRQRIQAFHQQHYVVKNAVIAIVGDVTRAHAEKIAEQLMSDLPEGQHAPALPDVPQLKASEISREFPSSQTHIYVGQPGMARHDKDYFALIVGNHVLGGSGLVSILGEEVREKRGLSYSVYSYFSPMRVRGPFIMSAQTKNDKAAEALHVMRSTLMDFVDNGPDKHALEESKKNIIGGFPLKVSSNKNIVDYLAMMGFYDYPLDWLDSYVEKVSQVTVEDVRGAFRRRLNTNAQTTVIVGGGQ